MNRREAELKLDILRTVAQVLGVTDDAERKKLLEELWKLHTQPIEEPK